MFSVLTLCVALISVQAHQDPPQSDADFQSALMPQELNTEFVSGQDDPLKVSFPLDRLRRSFDPPPSFSTQLKHYSRIASCVILAISAVVEIVLFLIELYNI